jgi:hypothetical protein
VEKLVAVQVRLVAHVGRDLPDRRVDALVVLVEEDGVHLDEVDDADELVLGADRQLKERRHCRETVLHHVDDHHEVGAGPVHLVDVGDARDAVRVRLPPHGLGLRLDAADSTEHRARAVQDAQGTLDLDGEVNVARRVYYLDPMVLPEAGGRRGRDGDPALLLLDHPVHRGRALVDLADLVRLPRIEEDALGRGRLTGIDVRHDADVPGVSQ